MRDLHEAIAERVAAWREARYRHEEFPAIAEVLHYAHDDPSGSLRYLRAAQFRALERANDGRPPYRILFTDGQVEAGTCRQWPTSSMRRRA